MGVAFYKEDISVEIAEKWRLGKSIQELREEYGYKTGKSIIDKLHKQGVTAEEIKKRKFQKDWSLDFSNLTPFTAYLLGLLATDGYISESQIGLDLTDEDCISFISKNTGKPYHAYDKTKYNITNSYKSKKTVYRITFNGQEIIDQLFQRGITRNKSKTISKIFFKEGEKNLYPYFIRGVIDGDGTIGYTSKNTIYLSIISYSIDFLDFLEEIFSEMGFVDLKRYKDHEGQDIFTSKKENIKILKEIYKEPFGMTRKRDKLFLR